MATAPRINRFLAQAGLGSRRSVEEMVRQGRVRVNGRVLQDLSRRIDPQDRVEVDGRPVRAPAPARLLAYHKPSGVVCSFRRQGRARCLADVLPVEVRRGRLFHVGRLDRESSGLLLLSDDGDLAHALLHPSHPVFKRYRVEVDAPLDETARERFRSGGLELDGRPCAPARLEALPGPTPAYRIHLREGRKRQIRRMMEALGRRVTRLHREAFGPVELGDLAPGGWRPLEPAEEEALRRAAD